MVAFGFRKAKGIYKTCTAWKHINFPYKCQVYITSDMSTKNKTKTQMASTWHWSNDCWARDQGWLTRLLLNQLTLPQKIRSLPTFFEFLRISAHSPVPDSRFQTGLRTPGALFSCLEYLQTDVICIHETLNYWVCWIQNWSSWSNSILIRIVKWMFLLEVECTHASSLLHHLPSFLSRCCFSMLRARSLRSKDLCRQHLCRQHFKSENFSKKSFTNTAWSVPPLSLSAASAIVQQCFAADLPGQLERPLRNLLYTLYMSSVYHW